MIRRKTGVALGLSAVVALAIGQLAACSSNEAAPGTGTPTNPDGASTTSDGGADGNNVPTDSGVGTVPPPDAQAVGDPCRGVPLPPEQHYVPAGLCARLVSAGATSLRQLMFASNGDLFGQSLNGKIYLFRDEDGDGFFAKSEIHLWGDTGSMGNNAHVDEAGGYVYAGFDTGIKRFSYNASAVISGASENVVVNIPSGGGHPKHTTHVYDGYLYVHSGSNGNLTHEPGDMAAYDTKRSLIKRFKLADFQPGTPFNWNDGEAFTVGLRNANGFKRNEITKRIYAVVNGADNIYYGPSKISTDNPGEQIVELAAGKQYGYPFCFTAQRVIRSNTLVPPLTQLAFGGVDFGDNPHDDDWCNANSSPPTTFVAAHSAPLDIAFFDQQPQGALPEKWRGGAFVAMHGSWNRDPATGYKVVWQPFNNDGTATTPTSTMDTTTFPYEIVFGGGTVAGGPKDGPWAWSSGSNGETTRPSGVAISPVDGALYVATDEGGGFVYRIGIQK